MVSGSARNNDMHPEFVDIFHRSMVNINSVITSYSWPKLLIITYNSSLILTPAWYSTRYFLKVDKLIGKSSINLRLDNLKKPIRAVEYPSE